MVRLERLAATRPLESMAEDTTAVQILAELLARLVAVPAPEGLRHLADIAAAMRYQTPRALPARRDPAERQLMRRCASAMAELISEPGDLLLHWTCTTTTSSPGTENRGWASIRSRSRATPALSCRRRRASVGSAGS